MALEFIDRSTLRGQRGPRHGLPFVIILAYALLSAAASTPADPPQLAQMTIQRRVVIRVPAAPAPRMAQRTRWREKRGPRCVQMSALAGAAVTEPDAVDLFMRGGLRLRARLETACPALDYYRGFYVMPTADGQMCADRDMIHSRAGGQCGIDRFRTLVPDR